MAIDSMEHERTAADMNRIPNAGWRMSGSNWIGTALIRLLVARILAMLKRSDSRNNLPQRRFQ
jgi:hypothetical protein